MPRVSKGQIFFCVMEIKKTQIIEEGIFDPMRESKVPFFHSG
jgi:hypothetical protein